jgi:NitT/TauT family transport system substrate-binding protein
MVRHLRPRAAVRAMIPMTFYGVVVAVIGLVMHPVSAQTPPLAPVTVGVTNSGTDVALLIAVKLGYFKDEGIDPQLVPFDAAGKMMAPIAAGQLDVATGAPSGALYNALARHVNIKIVADKGSAAPGYGFQPIVVRKALVSSGKYKSPKDLKGLTLAEASPGSVAAVFVAKFLKLGGLKYDDVKHVYLGFPSMIAALDSGAVDAAALAEPAATQAEQAGYIVRVMGNDKIYPNQQLTVLMYSDAFSTSRRPTAEKFMQAYLKGVRFYNDALVNGHLRGRTADEVVSILTEMTGMKDPNVFREMIASANNPNGLVNVASLKADASALHELGFVDDANVDLSGVIDPTFAEDAVKVMGPYHPRK